MFPKSRQTHDRKSESRMDKCEGKWVYFKTHIPDVMNKSLIFRQQRSRSNLKKKKIRQKTSCTHLSKLNVISEWVWMRVGSCHGWFPGGQLSAQLQKQHLPMLILICIACPRSASPNLQDSDTTQLMSILNWGKCWGRRGRAHTTRRLADKH